MAAGELAAALATLLVPAGVTPKRFAELAKHAFVKFAATTARLRNGKVNHAKVAVLTGLPRLEVKRLLGTDSASTEVRLPIPGPVERVISAWLSNPSFCTKSGAPRRLSIEGKAGSFAELVKAYGGDVTHRSVLDELQRIGAVRLSRSARNVALIIGSRSSWGQVNAQLSSLVPMIVDAIQIATEASNDTRGAINRLQVYARDPVELSIIKKRVRSAVSTLVSGLSASLGSTGKASKRRAAYELRLTVVISDGSPRKTGMWRTRTGSISNAGLAKGKRHNK